MLERLFALCFTAVGTLAALDPSAKHDDEFSMALKTAIAALATAVVAMYGFFLSRYRRLERLLEGRDKDSLKRERWIARLERQTGLVQAVSECGVEECALREAARRHFSELDAEGN